MRFIIIIRQLSSPNCKQAGSIIFALQTGASSTGTASTRPSVIRKEHNGRIWIIDTETSSEILERVHHASDLGFNRAHRPPASLPPRKCWLSSWNQPQRMAGNTHRKNWSFYTVNFISYESYELTQLKVNDFWRDNLTFPDLLKVQSGSSALKRNSIKSSFSCFN